MKTTAIILGASGAVVLAIGASLLGLFGLDGIWSSDEHLVGSRTPALVSDTAEVDGLMNGAGVLGNPRVRIDLGHDEFVGVARARDVERYLAGVSYDEVTDIESDPFGLE